MIFFFLIHHFSPPLCGFSKTKQTRCQRLGKDGAKTKIKAGTREKPLPWILRAILLQHRALNPASSSETPAGRLVEKETHTQWAEMEIYRFKKNNREMRIINNTSFMEDVELIKNYNITLEQYKKWESHTGTTLVTLSTISKTEFTLCYCSAGLDHSIQKKN